MISIIIPAYNAEKTIERAVNSVLCNRSADFSIEIIVINDGSTDLTPEICNRLSEEKGIRVIHTENHGTAAARGIGIREAKGDYIGFVDSDDWIEPNMYRLLLQAMIEQQADLAACGVIQETEYGCFRDKEDGFLLISEGKTIYRDILCSDGFRGYLWNKLYKRELLPFPADHTIAKCEDLLLNAAYCENVRKAVYLPIPLYHYTRNNYLAGGYTKRDLTLMDAYEAVLSIYQKEAPQYAYIPEQNVLKIYLHFRARAKSIHEKDDALLQKINKGIKAHFRSVMGEKEVPLKTKGNICVTYLFPKATLWAKRIVLRYRHKLGIWES